MFFSVYTLGCKLNQLESEAVTDSFRREGFTLIPWSRGGAEPALMIINTCTVTSMADQKARRVIRKALRDHGEACLIVTGCYAQMEAEALAALEAEISPEPRTIVPPDKTETRLFILRGERKDRLLDLPAFLAGAGALFETSGAEDIAPVFPNSALRGLLSSWFNSPALLEEGKDGAFRFRPVNFSTHSRGFLKIEDGCDNHCAYCRVSFARGKSRSLDAKEALKELLSLESRGFKEAVLTGVNIAQYRNRGMGLSALLEFLLEGTKTICLRLSSIEPDGLTDGFAGVLKNPRIRPHFHLSVQSGSAGILERMGRTYKPEDIERAAALFRSVKEDPFLACDIIAGFPGESEADFEETHLLCERSGFAWIHAFPFSPRPGTAAFDFPGRVSESEAARRVSLLGALARKGRGEYISRWGGKEAEAIIETGMRRGFVPALSENYLKLLVPSGEKPLPPGSALRCRILAGPPAEAQAVTPLPAGIDAWAEIVHPGL